MYVHKLDNSTINVSTYHNMEVETARICHILYVHTVCKFCIFIRYVSMYGKLLQTIQHFVCPTISFNLYTCNGYTGVKTFMVT